MTPPRTLPLSAVAASLNGDFDPMSSADPRLADAALARPSGEDCFSERPPVYRPVSADGRIVVSEAGLCDLLDAYAAHHLSPVDVLAELTETISTSQTGREAVLHILDGAAAAATESARRWHDGTARPLEGIPFGIKDIIDVSHTPVTSGSLLTGKRVAAVDAAVVSSLRAAGAIPFAMLATTEFAAGSPFNPRYGPVTNPWDRSRWTGGSSTGSGAALASRLLPLALGTDTGGSIRVPSCWCGTTGLKPTRDLVSRQGVSALSWTLDHVGPMTRSARDIAACLPFMSAAPDAELSRAAGELLRSDDTGSLSSLRIGIAGGWFTERVDAAVLDNWRSALAVLETAGATLVDLPDLPVAEWHAAGWIILTSELATLQSAQMDRAELFDKGLRARIELGRGHGAVEYGLALQARTVAQQRFLNAMHGIDAIATPGLGGEAGSLASLTVDVDGVGHAFQDIIPRNTMIFDLLGFPALMMPSGFGRRGLPTGVQIVARPHDDLVCLRIGMAFQTQTNHHHMAPPR